MSLKCLILVAALVAVAYARAQYGRDSFESAEAPHYNFDWAVQDSDSANHFDQQESRDDDNTKGTYSVLLPDGRTQKVTYYVDGDSGFIADVTYEGQARYEQPQPQNRYNPTTPKPRYG